MLEVKTHYSREGSYLDNGRGRVALGSKEGAFYPYDLFLGSLSACFHATLMSIMQKRRLETPVVDIVVTGEKREEVPTTMQWTKLAITAYDVPEEVKKAFEQSCDMAAKYCSIHHTIAQVSEMEHTIEYA
ncbi:MAG TPA: OsmC family protein [Tissierellia bacterium]|nr:OsmC family protein [Tissierellia bacterium]